MHSKERVLGALIGFAIGDAMGATTEFMSAEEIAKEYGQVTEIIGGGWLNLKPGQVTDDTQMTLCVYRAMRASEDCPKRTLRELCEQFRAWADSNPPDIGGACYRAIYGTKSLSPSEWIYHNQKRQQQSGKRDLGNGGLMRCLVPCLADDLKLCIDQSYLTHSDPIHEWYISIYYQVLHESLKGKKLHFSPLKKEPSGYVLNTLDNCGYWFLYSDSFENAIIGAVNNGGDADTIAALTGALAGAFYGVEAIPERWINVLDPEVLRELNECADWLTK